MLFTLWKISLNNWESWVRTQYTVSTVFVKAMSGEFKTFIKWKVLAAQSYLTLCGPMNYSLPCSSVRGISQARILDWVAIFSSRGSSQLRDRTWVSCLLHWQADSKSPLQADSLPSEWRGKYSSSVWVFVENVSVYAFAQSGPTLWDSMDCSPQGSSVHGILLARILEWVAINFSRGSSQPMDWTCISCIAGRVFTIWATRGAHLLKIDNVNVYCVLTMAQIFFLVLFKHHII